MELKHVKGNTWYWEGRQLIPIYQTDDHHCILMDPGRASEREGLERALQEAGLTPVGVMVTHMHYDHHENTRYFKEKYGALSAMSRGDAELCRDRTALRNHLYTFTPGMLDHVPRLQNLICSTDRIILPEESKIEFQGAEFGILHTPGHSPAHICIITPDNICFVGDAFMNDADLAECKIPFAFDLAQDLESKQKFLKLDCDTYLLAHQGVVRGSLERLIAANVELIDHLLALFCRVVDHTMSLSEIYTVVRRELEMSEGHPTRAFYLERYLRPYLDYLVDTGKLAHADGGGAPCLAPAETVQ